MALYVGFAVGVLATVLLPHEWFPPRLDPKESLRLTGLLVGTTAVFVFGLLDDRFEFPAGRSTSRSSSPADRHRLYHLHRADQQPDSAPDRSCFPGRSSGR